MNRNDLVKIRDFNPEEDINFIFASWLRGLYYGESWFSLIPKNIFMAHYHRVIEFILKKENTIIKIACLAEDENTILGYSVSSPDTIHWVFVKKSWRKIGIARSLVNKDSKFVSHLTKIGLSIIRNKNIDFNPFNL